MPYEKQQPEEVTIGGGYDAVPLVPLDNEDGTPKFYVVRVTSYRKKAGMPDDQGKETSYYSWKFNIVEAGSEYDGFALFGITNDKARRAITTGKPLKLLQLIMAVNGGKEPPKDEVWKLDDMKGKLLRVRLEEKTRKVTGEKFQQVCEYYPITGKRSEATDEAIDEASIDSV